MKSGDAEDSVSVTALVEGSNGVLWIVTTVGVYSIGDDDATALFLLREWSPHPDMIVETPDGSLWLGRGSSISEYTPAGTHVTTVQLSTLRKWKSLGLWKPSATTATTHGRG